MDRETNQSRDISRHNSDLGISTSRGEDNEYSSLLDRGGSGSRGYQTTPTTPRVNSRPRLSHHHSIASTRAQRSRATSFSQRLTRALIQRGEDSEADIATDQAFHKQWYDQFTSTDWVNDTVKDAFRVKELQSVKGFRGRLLRLYDAAQGWILVAIIGFITACVAYFVDVSENVLFDWKDGYCTNGWYFSRKKCCFTEDSSAYCSAWRKWSQIIRETTTDIEGIDYAMYIFFTVLLATMASLLTLTTGTALPGSVQISNVDEDLGANRHADPQKQNSELTKPILYYSAAGSGVAEVKVILSGFVLHGYLGLKTLIVKTIGLILSVSSGLNLGKEGPYVHIATCIGNICCRLFNKYNRNDAKRREVLSASAAAGVTVAFGAPLGGVLFSLEEVSYYFPPKTLFRTFFCCIVAALSLKFLDPYGTSKIVMFEVRYVSRWHGFELVCFVILGIFGGIYGALFIKASKFWALTFRKIKFIKEHPIFEVAIVALVSGVVSYWNRYTKLVVTELLFELSSPCTSDPNENSGLCPEPNDIPNIIAYLGIALVVKTILTVITFGTKVPAGIYVPTMVIGGIMGHMAGLTMQYVQNTFPDSIVFSACSADSPNPCIVPGVYAMVAAGATMCGVTRLSVTLAVILFELSGSLDHVLPFSLAVLVSKWTADALEPLSIYDLLTDLNSYPYLNSKISPVFTSELSDIISRLHMQRIIDISQSPLVPATDLRRKLQSLQAAGELDGGLPIIKDNILVGLMPAPDLEFALDNLENEEEEVCLMASSDVYYDGDSDDERHNRRVAKEPTDFTPYIDPAPVALEIRSPMELVYECFVKLGLRYLCILQEGQFVGMVHKKSFVKYLKDVSEGKAD